MNKKFIFIFLLCNCNLALAVAPSKNSKNKIEEVKLEKDESLNLRSYKALKLQVDSLRRRLEKEYQKAKRELETSSLEKKSFEQDPNL